MKTFRITYLMGHPHPDATVRVEAETMGEAQKQFFIDHPEANEISINEAEPITTKQIIHETTQIASMFRSMHEQSKVAHAGLNEIKHGYFNFNNMINEEDYQVIKKASDIIWALHQKTTEVAARNYITKHIENL